MSTPDALLARRDRLVSCATQTLAPLKLWWEQYGTLPTQPALTSYFSQCLFGILYQSQVEIEGMTRQHPHYLTTKKLDDFQRQFDTLSNAWWWHLREAQRFEALRSRVKPPYRAPQAVFEAMEAVVRTMTGQHQRLRAATPYIKRIEPLGTDTKEICFLADLAKQIYKSAKQTLEANEATEGCISISPPISLDPHFRIEHDFLYLKALEAYVSQLSGQIFAIYTPVITLMSHIPDALLEWRGILTLLDDSLLVAFAWCCHQELQRRFESRTFDATDLQTAYHAAQVAVQEAFRSQYARRPA